MESDYLSNQSLAFRMRPKSLDMIVGQDHLFGPKGSITKLVNSGKICNMIFYGPPGTGKTTAAEVIAKQSGMVMRKLNATTASLSDIKAVADETGGIMGSNGILLYLDEIQYFNRKQQQVLLEYIEDGRITLVASTTDNPYYYIYKAVLSRSVVFEFKPIDQASLRILINRAWDWLNDENGTSKTIDEEAAAEISVMAGGDARKTIGLTENLFNVAENGNLTVDEVKKFSFSTLGNFDAHDDVHYDLLSALQKSVRGSDPDAAVFYLAKLLAGGDIISVCRRLQVIASEDIGLAYPLAAVVTRSCCESAKELGLPEAAIPLANATVLLATSPKSNSANCAYEAAKADVDSGLGPEVPVHLQSPLFKGYLYPHSFQDHYVKQQYLPDDIKDRHYYQFGDSKLEKQAYEYWKIIKEKK